MSGILGVFGRDLPDDTVVRRMLGGLRARGADRVDVWRGTNALLAVSRFDWEAAPEFSGEAMVVDDGEFVVVADASLYYRDDLRRKLASSGLSVPSDATASELVVAAYRAWGDDAPTRLEGDFAYVVWDIREQRVSCARDFGGKRPLYHASFGDNFVVASTVSAITQHPQCDRRLNEALLAETIAQFWSAGDDTCYDGIRELLAGSSLRWATDDRSARAGAHWSPPPIGPQTPSSFDEGAEALRELLIGAVSERFAPAGETTAVWMSGGWDSPSVFAAGEAALERESRGRRLLPVSISYPEGDPGREDSLITAIAERWNAPICWLDVEQIPLFRNPAEGARERDLPFAHTYEHWNRALASASRGAGARVAFDGNGGDQLFQVSDVFLADLLASGRWIELARQWRVKGGKGLGTFLRWAVAPALPVGAARFIQTLRGGSRVEYLERTLPPWIRPDFARRNDMIARERARMPRRGRGWRREAHFLLASPYLSRAFQCLSGFALEAGVELRSPLYDRRIVEFACGRPREERNEGRETKRLLRRSMRGLLPDDLLAPRPFRTGITTAYSDRKMRESYPRLMEPLLDSLRLAELGIVDRGALTQGWQAFERTGANDLKIPLYLTLSVELWLRAREEVRVTEIAPTVDRIAVGIRH